MQSNKRAVLFNSERTEEVTRILKSMVRDERYNTKSSYSANVTDYPDHQIPFVDKHINYLRAHSSIDPDHYIANLRLITRIR